MAPITLQSPELTDLLNRLSLERKVLLLTGRDFWTTWPLPEIGLRAMTLSDGPSGVRGPVWDERDPSLNLPSATALSSAWDPALARRYGNAAAVEARRKGVDVVLGPTINLHRSPLGGRHFEQFSEDPVLTADLATAYVFGVQENGVAACPKHYIANDYETDRFTASSEVSDQALRELYLLAFEQPVVEGHAWSLMSAYNSINGVTASEHPLLAEPLKAEWGFDGVVVSDWTGVRTLDSAAAAQDLAMPGPEGPWGDALVAAVRDGRIPEEVIDNKVRRILLLAERVGALDSFAPAAAPAPVEDGVAFVREAAAEGTVLLANNGILPLHPDQLSRVAVIGHNARQARTQGGGSATVIPEKVVSPLEAIREALPDADVSYTIGAVVQEGIADLPLAEITNPLTGEPGALVRFLDGDGTELFREDRRATSLFYFGGDAPVATAAQIEMSTTWTPDTSGEVLVGFASVGRGRIYVDDQLLREATAEATGMDLGAAIAAPPAITSPVLVSAGEPVRLQVNFDLNSRAVMPGLEGIFGINVGVAADTSRPDQLIAEAVDAAAAADVAVVVVGTNSQIESEGFDRANLALPGRQDDLVRAIVATGTPTVVVINAGAPVLLPWRDEVAALLVPYFAGQEMGSALADVLLGVSEPGGRLPTTWPGAEADIPVLDVTPVDGKVAYSEGIHIGYRAWLKTHTTPAFPFGHGLGYTTWQLDHLTVSPTLTASGSAQLAIQVTNTGTRAGKQVVQVYLSAPNSSLDRPVRWLAGYAPVRAAAGETVPVAITVPARAFATWNDDAWRYETGRYQVQVGTSVTDLPLEDTVRLTD
jgi:beta-glucosidase